MSAPLAAAAWSLAFGALPVEAGLALREAGGWRHFPANDAARYAALLDIAALDAFLRTDAARHPRVAMADGAREGSAAVPPAQYLRPDDRVDLPRLFAAFDAGATLIVSQFDELHPPLARFCRGLERVFLHPVQANIYLTPGGAQGFRTHFDTHDVLVLQLAGEKAWRVFPGAPVPWPTRATPWPGGIAPTAEPVAVPLRPGDALYLARGVMHDAAAQQGGPSLHATIGFLEPSWAEALRLAADALERLDPALRTAFPTWRLAAPGALAAAAAPLAARLASPEALERVGVALLDRLATERLLLPGRGLLRSPPGAADRVRLAEAMHHHVAPLGEGGQLRWAGGRIELSGTELGWLAALAEGAAAAELGEGALAFVTRLAAAGLLEAAD